MKYPYEFKKNTRAALVVILILSLLLALYNVLSLAEVFPFFSRNRVVEGAALIVSGLIAAFSLLVYFGSSYTVGEHALIIAVAFIPFYKIPYGEITNIREYTKQGNLMLGYLSKKAAAPRAVYVFIAKNTFDNFAATLKEKNREILYDSNEE